MNSRGNLAQLGLAGCLILVGTCWVSGQQGRPYRTYRPQEDLSGVEFRTDSRFETMQPATAPLIGQRSTALVGSCLKLPDGQRIGRVDDLIINEDGCVDFMVVSFDGSSEFRGRLAAIPWRVGKADFRARAVTLNVERDMLREAPIFFSRGTAWPNLYEPQWAASVHNYFGVETDISQRVERAYGAPESRDIDRDLEMRRGERGRDVAEPRDLEQRRQIKQPADRHLDPKPAPMPDGNIAPEPGLDRNGARDQGRNIRSNNDDEFSGVKSERDRNGTNNGKKTDGKQLDTDEDDSPRPPE